MLNENIRLFLNKLEGTPDSNSGLAQENLQQRIRQAYDLFPNLRISLVADWNYINVFNKEELYGSFLFSNNLIDESEVRGFDWVRSSLLVSYFHPGLFVTRNTCYVLIADGKQSKVSLSDISWIFK